MKETIILFSTKSIPFTKDREAIWKNRFCQVFGFRSILFARLSRRSKIGRTECSCHIWLTNPEMDRPRGQSFCRKWRHRRCTSCSSCTWCSSSTTSSTLRRQRRRSSARGTLQSEKLSLEVQCKVGEAAVARWLLALEAGTTEAGSGISFRRRTFGRCCCIRAESFRWGIRKALKRNLGFWEMWPEKIAKCL